MNPPDPALTAYSYHNLHEMFQLHIYLFQCQFCGLSLACVLVLILGGSSHIRYRIVLLIE